MKIRRATADDVGVLAELLRAFESEIPEPPHRDFDLEREVADIREYVGTALALLAEEDDASPSGFALARLESPRVCFLSDLYVRPAARRRGVARALIGEVVAWGSAQGAEVMTLEVLTTNVEGRSFYERLGFDEESRNLVTPLPALSGRLAETEQGPSFGSVNVQTDEVEAVLRAVRQYVPRLPGNSRGSAVVPPRNGWTAVFDELCDRDPPMLRRLALELSDRMGAVVLSLGVEHGDVVRYVLYERGSIVDEYLSVPEYHGPLPPGDVIGLGANPTVVARLTGADPGRVREVALTARAPSELPPATALLDELAAVMGVDGAAHGYAEARRRADVTLIDRL